MKTSATNKKVRELINAIRDEKIVPRPEFQRRLVWKNADKEHFLDSVLRGYPFPEIYVADGEVDIETGEGTQLLVDGLQRLTTLHQYFYDDEDLSVSAIPKYKNLSEDQKRAFLQYDVAVRDLGSVSGSQIVEVFQRINATKYDLKEIEVNNAVYQGEFKKFCESLSEKNFFQKYRVFNAQDYKRMGDLRFVISVVITLMGGYFNRDEQFENYLARFNENFWEGEGIRARMERVIEFLEEVNLERGSRLWRKADLYTAFAELDFAFQRGVDVTPSEFQERIGALYSSISESGSPFHAIGEIYHKAALQASNDRLNRVRRGHIVRGLLVGKDTEAVLDDLRREQLV